MADKRMISRALGSSKKVKRMCHEEQDRSRVDLAVCLYALGIPCHDDYGNIFSNPHDWKYKIYPATTHTEKEIYEALLLLIKYDLFRLSDCGDVLKYIGHEQHQKYRADRAKRNDYPAATWEKSLMNMSSINPMKQISIKIEEKKEMPVEKPDRTKILLNVYYAVVISFPEFAYKDDDDEWFIKNVLNDDRYQDVDIKNELKKWGFWLDNERELKLQKKSNKFPKKNFRVAFRNWLDNHIRYEVQRKNGAKKRRTERINEVLS